MVSGPWFLVLNRPGGVLWFMVLNHPVGVGWFLLLIQFLENLLLFHFVEMSYLCLLTAEKNDIYQQQEQQKSLTQFCEK